MDGQTIPRGFVAVSGGKIAGWGPWRTAPPWEGETVDAGGDHVLPGFIDAHSHLGMFGDAVGFEGDDGNEATDPCTPHLRAIDAINPQDRCFQEAREGGVTTVLTGPGSANPVSGQFAAIKTAGRWVDEMIVKAPAAMKMALGENPKCVYNERHETPVTRMATAAIIRENLSKALEYVEKLDRAEEDEDEERPDFDPSWRPCCPWCGGPARPHPRPPGRRHRHRGAHRQRVPLKVRHRPRHRGPSAARAAGSGGHPRHHRPQPGGPEQARAAEHDHREPGQAGRPGVDIAICTDHPETPVQYLPMCAAMAVKGGLSREQALAAITIGAARIAGIADRVGSLTPGKDADIVITHGDPLDMLCQVRKVWIDGRLVKG
ncbi:MAG: amidohydrolase family protein [Lawsonibacter sp.]